MNNNKEILEINIEDIIPNRFQPRLTFDMEALNELANSIKIHGIIQPLVVRKIQDKYEIIAGERRYKAATIIGMKTVPCIVMNLNDNESAEVAVVENIQRKEMTPLEEAKSFKLLLDKGYLTQDELARKMGKSQSSIANKLRLLNLDEMVQDSILNGKISERHARSLLKINDKEKQRQILSEIIEKRLTVKQTDDLIKEKYGVENMNTPEESINNINPQFNQNNNQSFNQNISRPEVNIPINNVINDVNPQLNIISNLGRIDQNSINPTVQDNIELKTDPDFDESKNAALNIFRDNPSSQINNSNTFEQKPLESQSLYDVQESKYDINNIINSASPTTIEEEKRIPANNNMFNSVIEENKVLNTNDSSSIDNLLRPNVFNNPNSVPIQNNTSIEEEDTIPTKENLINLSELSNGKKEDINTQEEFLIDPNENITYKPNKIKDIISKIDSEIMNFKQEGTNIQKEEKDLGNSYEIIIRIDK